MPTSRVKTRSKFRTLIDIRSARSSTDSLVSRYGLVSYAVSQRAAEIGLRMAFGATQRDVTWMILRQAATLGIAGALVGLGLVALIRPLVSRTDPPTAVAVAAILVAVVLTAAWLPARRASRIEPTLALRGQ